MVAEQQLAEQPKKRKKRPRVKYLDMEVPAAEGERRAALQKNLRKREMLISDSKYFFILLRPTYGGTRMCLLFQFKNSKEPRKGKKRGSRRTRLQKSVMQMFNVIWTLQRHVMHKFNVIWI